MKISFGLHDGKKPEQVTTLIPSKLIEKFVASLPSWLNDKKSRALGSAAQDNIKVLDYGAVNFFEVLNPKNHLSGYVLP